MIKSYSTKIKIYAILIVFLINWFSPYTVIAKKSEPELDKPYFVLSLRQVDNIAEVDENDWSPETRRLLFRLLLYS